jgi:antitoxin ParD1/3/4
MTKAEEIQIRMDELMRSGRYPSREALMLEALDALQDRDFWDEDLEEALERGLADLEAGRTQPLEQVFDALEARMRRG